MFESQITLEELMSKVSSFDIFMHYCTNFKYIGKPFCSEFRPDKNPSCNIKMYNGDLLYKDFGNGDSFRAIDYVMHKYDIEFNEAINKIYGEIGRNFRQNSKIYSNNSDDCDFRICNNVNDRTHSVIKIKSRNWSAWDRKFWQGRYNISQSTLEKFQVKPISHYWINDYFFEAPEICYSYDFYWEDNIFRRKIYQPFESQRFWSNGGAICQGEGMLPRNGELLIITKSLKDVIELYEMNIIAIAPPSEHKWLPEAYFNKQRQRFNKIVTLFDNDNVGVKKSKEFSEKYDIPFILIPESYQDCKDISDVVYKYGFEEATKLIKRLLDGIGYVST